MSYFNGHMLLFVWSCSFTSDLLIILGIQYVYKHLYIFKDVKIHMLSHFSASMSFFRLLFIRGILVPQTFNGGCYYSFTFLSHYLFLSSQYSQLHLALPGLYSKRFKCCLVDKWVNRCRLNCHHFCRNVSQWTLYLCHPKYVQFISSVYCWVHSFILCSVTTFVWSAEWEWSFFLNSTGILLCIQKLIKTTCYNTPPEEIVICSTMNLVDVPMCPLDSDRLLYFKQSPK